MAAGDEDEPPGAAVSSFLLTRMARRHALVVPSPQASKRSLSLSLWPAITLRLKARAALLAPPLSFRLDLNSWRGGATAFTPRHGKKAATDERIAELLPGAPAGGCSGGQGVGVVGVPYGGGRKVRQRERAALSRGMRGGGGGIDGPRRGEEAAPKNVSPISRCGAEQPRRGPDAPRNHTGGGAARGEGETTHDRSLRTEVHVLHSKVDGLFAVGLMRSASSWASFPISLLAGRTISRAYQPNS
jgi:hypothetical protein